MLAEMAKLGATPEAVSLFARSVAASMALSPEDITGYEQVLAGITVQAQKSLDLQEKALSSKVEMAQSRMTYLRKRIELGYFSEVTDQIFGMERLLQGYQQSVALLMARGVTLEEFLPAASGGLMGIAASFEGKVDQLVTDLERLKLNALESMEKFDPITHMDMAFNQAVEAFLLPNLPPDVVQQGMNGILDWLRKNPDDPISDAFENGLSGALLSKWGPDEARVIRRTLMGTFIDRGLPLPEQYQSLGLALQGSVAPPQAPTQEPTGGER